MLQKKLAVGKKQGNQHQQWRSRWKISLTTLSRDKAFQNHDVLEISPFWCHKARWPLTSYILMNLKYAQRKHLHNIYCLLM